MSMNMEEILAYGVLPVSHIRGGTSTWYMLVDTDNVTSQQRQYWEDDETTLSMVMVEQRARSAKLNTLAGKLDSVVVSLSDGVVLSLSNQ